MPNVTEINLRPALVSIVDSSSVECLLDPAERWNGFACPRFRREQLPALFAMLAECGDMPASLDADDVVRVLSPDCGDEPDEFEPTVVDGVQMWAVGAWGWAWNIDSIGSACPDCGQTPDEPDPGWHSCPTCGRAFQITALGEPEGRLTDVECPGCGQRIYRREDGSTECGGRDEGTCAEANYAHDRARGIAEPEWLSDEHTPPDPGDCENILTAHRLVSDGEVR